MKNYKKTMVLIFGCLIGGLLFGYTAGSFYHANHRSEEIVEILKSNCECEEVNQLIYATGVQFGKNGITTEKGEYQLVDCELTSVKEEVDKLHKILKRKVKGYERIDLLELEFVNKGQREIVLIKNGKIQ